MEAVYDRSLGRQSFDILEGWVAAGPWFYANRIPRSGDLRAKRLLSFPFSCGLLRLLSGSAIYCICTECVKPRNSDRQQAQISSRLVSRRYVVTVRNECDRVITMDDIYGPPVDSLD